MNNLDAYKIYIQEIKRPGVHRYEFQIDNNFFKEFNYDDYQDVSVKINLTKKNEHKKIELQLELEGWVEVNCDLSYDLFKLEIKNKAIYLVRFQETQEDHEDVISVLPDATFINIAQQIYELVVLSIPMKRIHPDIVNGIRKKPTFASQEGSFIDDEFSENNIKTSDPRWDQLKKLVVNKNINYHGTPKEEDIKNQKG